jgi:hypothetical protein
MLTLPNLLHLLVVLHSAKSGNGLYCSERYNIRCTTTGKEEAVKERQFDPRLVSLVSRPCGGAVGAAVSRVLIVLLQYLRVNLRDRESGLVHNASLVTPLHLQSPPDPARFVFITATPPLHPIRVCQSSLDDSERNAVT